MDELWHLLTDWPHWAFEGITDLTFSIIFAWPIAAWRIRRHDRKHHKGHTND